ANSPSFEDQAAMGFLPDRGKKSDRSREGCRRAAARCPFCRRHRASSGQRLFSRQAGPGNAHQERSDPLYAGPRDAVHGVPSCIAQLATEGNTVRLSHAFIQPMAAEDVATAVVEAALAPPANGMIEVGGPEK